MASTAVKATLGAVGTTAVVGAGAALTPVGRELIDAASELIDRNRQSPLVGQGMLVTASGIGALTAASAMAPMLGALHPALPRGVQVVGVALVASGAYTIARAPLEVLRQQGRTDGQHVQGMAQAEPLAPQVPDTVAELAAVQVARAEVVTSSGDARARPAVYLDVDSARPAAGGVDDAIRAARDASRADAKARAHAVVETSDGQLHVVRLTSVDDSLDRIDGPFYADGTGFDRHRAPLLASRQPGLHAIVGVELIARLEPGGES